MAQYELNLRDYWRVLRKRKLTVLLFPILIASLSFLMTPSLPPAYQAVSSVKISQSTSVAGLLLQAITWSEGDNLATQAKLIQSQPIIIKIAQRLGLIDQGLTSSEVVKDSRNINIVNDLRTRVQATPAENTSIIEVRAAAGNKEGAIRLANAAVDVYCEENTYKKNRQAIESREFIEGQLGRYQEALSRSEEKLRRFQEGNLGQIHSDSSQIIALQDKLEKIRGRREALEKQLVQLKERRQSKEGGFIDWLSIEEADSALQKFNDKLLDLQMKKGELLLYYQEKAPQVVNVEKEIQLLIDSLVREYSGVIEGLKNREEELEKRLSQFPAKGMEFAQLDREVRVNKETYALLKARYQEALIQEAGKIKEVEVVEYATDANRVAESSRVSRLLLGLVIGGLLGVVLAFVVETMDTSIGTIEDVESFLNISVLGVIPHLDTASVKDQLTSINPQVAQVPSLEAHCHLVTLYDAKSPAAEAYRSLRTSIEFASLKKHGKSFVITSSTLQEGKSTTAANLAIATAQAGKRTLLLGCDWRRPFLYKIFGLKKMPGLTDIILGTATLEEVTCSLPDFFSGKLGMQSMISTPGIDNLHVIPCGTIPPNPSELLGSQQMEEFLAELKKSYDMVLIDVPPVLPVADALIMAAKVEGTILVYRLGKVGRGVLKRANASLNNVQAQVWGIVLNDLKPEVSGFSAESHYYKYYEETTPPSKKKGFSRLFKGRKRRGSSGKRKKSSTHSHSSLSENEDILNIIK